MADSSAEAVLSASPSARPPRPHGSDASLPPPRPLPVLREQIDGVDAKLVDLLNDRAKLVMEVGRRKIADGTPVYAPHREQAVLARVLALNSGPLLDVTLEAVYREIMSGSFALERPLRIGYLGPPGSFSHEAAVKQFGSSVSYENLRSIDGVFEEVARGHVDYGLVPVENGSVGSVAETLEGFMTHGDRVAVCAEVQLSIAQALITAPGSVPSDVRVISSKPEALAQCRRWLGTQYPGATIAPAASTSAAVEELARAHAGGDPAARHMAAIGSKLAATLHGMEVLFPEINDVTPNVTRFLVLCSASTAAAVTAASGADKTSVLFVCRDAPGALRDVLDAFARAGVNLTHIDKRPCPPATLARLVSVAADEGGGRQLGGRAAWAAATANGGGSGGADAADAPAAGAAAEAAPAAAAASTAGGAAKSATTAALAPSLLVPSLTGGRGSATLPFVYAFFIEAAGHVTTPAVAQALRDAATHCVCLTVLGSFPSARRVL